MVLACADGVYNLGMPARLRKKAKIGRCTPKEHAAAASHRKAEAKYVAANHDKHLRAAKDYYRKNKAKVKAQRAQAKTTKGKAVTRARRKQYGGSRGRPREC